MATLDRSRLLPGALSGAGAYLLGYLLVYVVAAGRVGDSITGQVLEATGEGTWKAVGWLFYNAHFVDTVGTFSGFGIEVTRSVNLVGDGFSPVLFLLPPGLLLAAGVAATRAAGIPDDAGDAAAAGGAVVLGYLPPAVLGAVVVGVSGDAGSLGPALPSAVLLAGVVYPVAFGALGGLLARGTA
jgi:hypothetical protein